MFQVITKSYAINNINKILSNLSINVTQRTTLSTSSLFLHKSDTHAHPPSKEPSSTSQRWEPFLPMRTKYPEYTIEPLPFNRTGGRGPNGRIWTHRKGGGLPRKYRMIDWIRGGPSSGKPLIEKVHEILDDDMRTAKIALVSSGTKRRYIIATENMKAGDMIKSSTELTKLAVRASDGDSYPLGSLAVGTLVSCVQLFPGNPGNYACSAGVTALLLRKLGDKVVIRLPSKQEVTLSAKCTATVGRVSNVQHNTRELGKAGAKRWLGIRPKSGRWHRKHPSIFGRRIKGPKKMKVYETVPRKTHKEVVLGRSMWD